MKVKGEIQRSEGRKEGRKTEREGGKKGKEV